MLSAPQGSVSLLQDPGHLAVLRTSLTLCPSLATPSKTPTCLVPGLQTGAARVCCGPDAAGTHSDGPPGAAPSPCPAEQDAGCRPAGRGEDADASDLTPTLVGQRAEPWSIQGLWPDRLWALPLCLGWGCRSYFESRLAASWEGLAVLPAHTAFSVCSRLPSQVPLNLSGHVARPYSAQNATCGLN